MRKNEILHLFSIVFLAVGTVFTALNLFKSTKNERNPIIALFCVSLSGLLNSLGNICNDDCYYCDCDEDDCDCGFCD